jgi:iron complex outermembrane receptor protein
MKPLISTGSAAAFAACSLACTLAPAQAAETPRKSYDIARGDAVGTLKRFADESGRQVVFLVDVVRGVTTNPVRGEYTGREALTRLVADTGLIVAEDAKSGALMVNRARVEESPAAKAKPTPSPTNGNTFQKSPMKKNSLFSVIGAWLALSLSSAQAQEPGTMENTGVVQGRVLNQATGQYLEGAQVQVAGSNRSALTTRMGYFELGGLPTGPQQLSISYAGLDSRTVTANVVGTRTDIGEVALTAGVYRLDAFVVPGEREGNALAITQQRNAPNVKNVMSSDAFGNVADDNIGNFLVRMPSVTGQFAEGQVTYIRIRGIDPNLNAVTVDGTRAASGGTRAGLDRRLEIDSIPADFVDQIEITKAPTPDMDADSIGGSVNLKTKSALNQKGRVVSFRVGTTYGTARKTLKPQGSFMYSDLLGRERNLGVMITGTFSAASNPRDTNFGAWQPTSDTTRPAYFTLSSAGEDYFEHKRGGMGVRFDYRLNPNSTIYANLMYSESSDRLYRRRMQFGGTAAANILPGFTEFITETRNQTFSRTQVERRRGVRRYNLHVGGEQKIAGGVLDYNFNYSPSEGFELRTNTSPQVTGVGFRFDRGATINDPALATFVQISGPSITDPASMRFPNLGFTDETKKESIFGGQANFRKPLAFGTSSFLKAGVRFRHQAPEVLASPATYTYVGPGGAQLGRFFDQYYTYQPTALRGTMPSVRWFHIPTVVHEWQTRPEYFRIDPVTTLRQQLVADRRASESVYAAYAMAGTEFGRLGILGGVRFEETRVEGTGTFQFISAEERARRAAWVGSVTEAENLRRTQAEYGNRVTNESKYRNVFPGLHFRYEIARGLQARLSYSAGIGRPNFGTIIPNDSANDQTQIVTANNTALKPQSGDNYDLTLEYYLNPAGLISVGVFQKDVGDFIFTQDIGTIGVGVDNGFNGEYVGYLLRSQTNGGSARLRGLEMNVQHQFSNLPGFWRGFGMYANHTWLEPSGQYLSQRIGNSGNVGLSYIDRGWTVRLHQNFARRSLIRQPANPLTQAQEFGRRRVDLSVSKRITRHLTVFADAINLLGDPLDGQSYIYVPGRKRGADTFNPEIKTGISGRF